MSTTPLGMHEKYFSALNEKQASLLARLSDWPLDVLTKKLTDSGLFTDKDDIDRSVLTYKQFMFFKGSRLSPAWNPDNICSMYSPKVDAIWHTHILYTREYAAFCNEVFGHFVHHTPCDLLNMSDAQLDINNWINGFQQAFGDLPDDFDDNRFPMQCG